MSELKKFDLKKAEFSRATLPVFSESIQRLPWVLYGLDNLMPNYIVQLFDNCAVHKAVITSKVNQIMGDGLVSLNNPMATINLVNDRENVSEVMRKCALDYMLFGGFCLNTIWSKDRKSIAEIYHVDFSRIRTGKLIKTQIKLIVIIIHLIGHKLENIHQLKLKHSVKKKQKHHNYIISRIIYQE
jgi:hypothetical protein